ncbi:MAG TPA: DUF167 family protein [Xanthobacteraceae bacterium]|nr:DUF167 family protein [Xanthobacteraceae bacterium]
MGPAAWSVQPDGVRVDVRATPRGGRDAVDGVAVLADGRLVLKARIAVAAEDGKANAALARLLGNLVGLPVSRVTLLHGASARLKCFHLAGPGPEIAAKLDALYGGGRS